MGLLTICNEADPCAFCHDRIGHLGKRVRRGAKHGGALVRVDAYCPRKSHFLLCNEDTGVVSCGTHESL